MHVRVVAARQRHRRVEVVVAERGEARSTERQSRVHQLHVALPQRVVDHVLVLEHRDRTGGVNEHRTVLRATHRFSLENLLGVDGVDGVENQLLLNGGIRLDVLDGSVLLDRRIVRDDAETRAGGVQ